MLIFLATAVAAAQVQRAFLHMPAVADFARQDPSGTTVLPEGRWLRPIGVSVPVKRWPYGLALTPDGSKAFVASDGWGQWVDGWQTQPEVQAFSTEQAGS